MKVSLSAELEGFVRDQVQSGQYPTPEQVVRRALQVLQEQEKWIADRTRQLKQAVGVGLSELDRGEGEPWDVAEIKSEARRIRAAGAGRATRSKAGKRKST